MVLLLLVPASPRHAIAQASDSLTHGFEFVHANQCLTRVIGILKATASGVL